MTFYLSGLNPVLLFIILFAIICSYTIGGLLIVHNALKGKKVHWTGLRFLTSFFTIIGALLGLILAMVLVSVWQNYQKEKEKINEEVASFTMLFVDAGGLPTKDREYVRGALKKLTHTIIYDSWPEMEKGAFSINPGLQIGNLYKYLGNLDSEDPRNKAFAEKMMKDLENISGIRKNRNLNATQSFIPKIMWQIIGLCTLISITSGFFFHLKPFWVHTILSLLHASMITIVIFLILTMTYPYRGGSKIDPDPYEELITKIFPIIEKNILKNKD